MTIVAARTDGLNGVPWPFGLRDAPSWPTGRTVYADERASSLRMCG